MSNINLSKYRHADFGAMEDDDLLEAREELCAKIEEGTGFKHTEALAQLLEIERELTIREE